MYEVMAESENEHPDFGYDNGKQSPGRNQRGAIGNVDVNVVGGGANYANHYSPYKASRRKPMVRRHSLTTCSSEDEEDLVVSQQRNMKDLSLRAQIELFEKQQYMVENEEMDESERSYRSRGRHFHGPANNQCDLPDIVRRSMKNKTPASPPKANNKSKGVLSSSLHVKSGEDVSPVSSFPRKLGRLSVHLAKEQQHNLSLSSHSSGHSTSKGSVSSTRSILKPPTYSSTFDAGDSRRTSTIVEDEEIPHSSRRQSRKEESSRTSTRSSLHSSDHNTPAHEELKSPRKSSKKEGSSRSSRTLQNDDEEKSPAKSPRKKKEGSSRSSRSSLYSSDRSPLDVDDDLPKSPGKSSKKDESSRSAPRSSLNLSNHDTINENEEFPKSPRKSSKKEGSSRVSRSTADSSENSPDEDVPKTPRKSSKKEGSSRLSRSSTKSPTKTGETKDSVTEESSPLAVDEYSVSDRINQLSPSGKNSTLPKTSKESTVRSSPPTSPSRKSLRSKTIEEASHSDGNSCGEVSNKSADIVTTTTTITTTTTKTVVKKKKKKDGTIVSTDVVEVLTDEQKRVEISVGIEDGKSDLPVSKLRTRVTHDSETTKGSTADIKKKTLRPSGFFCKENTDESSPQRSPEDHSSPRISKSPASVIHPDSDITENNSIEAKKRNSVRPGSFHHRAFSSMDEVKDSPLKRTESPQRTCAVPDSDDIKHDNSVKKSKKVEKNLSENKPIVANASEEQQVCTSKPKRESQVHFDDKDGESKKGTEETAKTVELGVESSGINEEGAARPSRVRPKLDRSLSVSNHSIADIMSSAQEWKKLKSEKLRPKKERAKRTKVRVPREETSVSVVKKQKEIYVPAVKDLKLHKVLGEGSFGQVWLASFEDMVKQDKQRTYALKILSKFNLIQNREVESVRNEIEVLKRVRHQHPCIMNLIAATQDDNLIYLMQEFAQGGELFSVLQKHRDPLTGIGGVPEKQASFYMACLTDALCFLHTKHQLVFRDLKPENVMLNKFGYPVIIDFGYAKFLDNVPDKKTYTLVGTPRYMSPELILSLGYSYSTDNWSLGVLIYEILSGYNPFEGPLPDGDDGLDEVDLFAGIVEDEYAPIPESAPLSKEANDIIKALLTKEPSERLGSGSPWEILDHDWFVKNEIDFHNLRRRKLRAPWVPEIEDALDARHFDNFDHLANNQEKCIIKSSYPKLTPREAKQFAGFDS